MRCYIEWNYNYNNTFYLRIDPTTNNISIVTNSNGKCKEEWSCVSYEIVETFKCKWDEIQKSLYEYKYRQITQDIKFIKITSSK
jgi:hypothetical protein